jgi:hypothetical protein
VEARFTPLEIFDNVFLNAFYGSRRAQISRHLKFAAFPMDSHHSPGDAEPKISERPAIAAGKILVGLIPPCSIS